ncbi:hypothetical protein CRG98_014592 [Punica granatum]|uniref:Uncharacterized protein n=1 Tax=Punica granatum TaxID=22663 RepID=A0A2I0K8Y8_PUNGR|nr:hypothetical protein CRG98_014592 [Punica granatum]
MGLGPTEDQRFGLGPMGDLTMGLGPTEDQRLGLGPVGDLTMGLGPTEDQRLGSCSICRDAPVACDCPCRTVVFVGMWGGCYPKSANSLEACVVAARAIVLC